MEVAQSIKQQGKVTTAHDFLDIIHGIYAIQYIFTKNPVNVLGMDFLIGTTQLDIINNYPMSFCLFAKTSRVNLQLLLTYLLSMTAYQGVLPSEFSISSYLLRYSIKSWSSAK